MIPENLSSESVGKKFFKRWVQPFDSYRTGRIRDAGKYSFIHIDGTLRGLIGKRPQTGFRCWKPSHLGPAGDIEPEDLHNWVEPGVIIWGGIPGVYFTDLISDEEFDAYVIRVLEVWEERAALRARRRGPGAASVQAGTHCGASRAARRRVRTLRLKRGVPVNEVST